MEVYGGSSNASRIAGEYMYPVRVYNTQPVEKINEVKARKLENTKVAQDIAQTNFDHYDSQKIKQKFESQQKSVTMYESAPFRNKDFAQKGLLLNIMG